MLWKYADILLLVLLPLDLLSTGCSNMVALDTQDLLLSAEQRLALICRILVSCWKQKKCFLLASPINASQ
jgi:hypothetical protein